MGVSKKLEALSAWGARNHFVLNSAQVQAPDQSLPAGLIWPIYDTSFIVVIARHRPVHRRCSGKNQPGAVPDARHLPAIDYTNCRCWASRAHGRPNITSLNRSVRLRWCIGYHGDVLFQASVKRMEGADVPGIFKGSAIAMVTAG